MNIDTAKEKEDSTKWSWGNGRRGGDWPSQEPRSTLLKTAPRSEPAPFSCLPTTTACVCLWISPSLTCSFVFAPGYPFLALRCSRSNCEQAILPRSLSSRPVLRWRWDRTRLTPFLIFFDFIPVWVGAQNFIHLVWVQNFKFVSFYAGNYWPTTSGNCKGVSTIPIEKKPFFLHIGCLEAQTGQTKFPKESKKALISLFQPQEWL